MLRKQSIPRLQLFGPDKKHGAWVIGTLKRYIWHAVWYEGGRMRKSSLSIEFGDDPKEAFAGFLSTFGQEQPKSRGPSADPLITDLLREYIEARGEAAESAPQLRNRVITLGTYFAGKRTSEIDEKACRDFAKTRASDGTARLELGTLSAALNYSVDNRLISWRPKVWRPQEPTTTQDALTEKQVEILFAAWRLRTRSQHQLLAAIIQYFTAARADSVLTLAWEKSTEGGHVDLEANTINFNPDGRARTGKVKPTIMIPAKLRPYLEEARRHGRALVCEGPRGAPGLRVYEKTFAAVVADAGLPAGTTPHTLCHTRISLLVAAGVPIEKVATYTGRTAERIRETYLHLAPTAYREVHDAL